MKASRSPSPSMSAKVGVEEEPTSTPLKGLSEPVCWVKLASPGAAEIAPVELSIVNRPPASLVKL